MKTAPGKIYSADRIFTGENWLQDHAIVVGDGIITDILPSSSLPAEMQVETYSDHFIAPAFIDLQIYGGSGRLLAVYPDKVTLQKIVDYSISGGAAYCLPTVATNKKEVFFRAIDAIRDYWNSGGDGVLGLHIEGPWINPEKKGAHVKELIHPPKLNEVKELLEYGKGIIKMITLAPEVCSREVIDLILSYDVIISAGHSNANYSEAIDSFNNGVSAVTHLFNAMSSFQHREPGLAGAAMDHDKVMASIIPDGYHVDHAAIRIAKKAMGERLYVITDAVTDTQKGYYQHTSAGNKYEAAGILSGSALTMNKAVQNLVNHARIGLAEALRMCSLYPARLIQRNDLGKLEKGRKGKIVVIDSAIQSVQLI
jgi:N-acetylglucosamine-6-phosphate deacetylase